MRRQCAQEAVVGNRERRNELRKLSDPLLRVYKVDDRQEPKMKVVREDAGRQLPQEAFQKPSDRVRVPVFVGAYEVNVPFYVQIKR